MEQGDVIPLYGRVLLGAAVFRAAFKWLLALPILVAFLLIALLSGRETTDKQSLAGDKSPASPASTNGDVSG